MNFNDDDINKIIYNKFSFYCSLILSKIRLCQNEFNSIQLNEDIIAYISDIFYNKLFVDVKNIVLKYVYVAMCNINQKIEELEIKKDDNNTIINLIESLKKLLIQTKNSVYFSDITHIYSKNIINKYENNLSEYKCLRKEKHLISEQLYILHKKLNKLKDENNKLNEKYIICKSNYNKSKENNKNNIKNKLTSSSKIENILDHSDILYKSCANNSNNNNISNTKNNFSSYSTYKSIKLKKYNNSLTLNNFCNSTYREENNNKNLCSKTTKNSKKNFNNILDSLKKNSKIMSIQEYKTQTSIKDKIKTAKNNYNKFIDTNITSYNNSNKSNKNIVTNDNNCKINKKLIKESLNNKIVNSNSKYTKTKSKLNSNKHQSEWFLLNKNDTKINKTSHQQSNTNEKIINSKHIYSNINSTKINKKITNTNSKYSNELKSNILLTEQNTENLNNCKKNNEFLLNN